MQATIAVETIHAAAVKRHALQVLVHMIEENQRLGSKILKKGYAKTSEGKPCQSNDPLAVTWSVYGLYEKALGDLFPATPVFRYHMHYAVGRLASHVIGLAAEALFNYNPDAVATARVNRGMDWLIFEAPKASMAKYVPNVIKTAADFIMEVPEARMMEPVMGRPSLTWLPSEYPPGAVLVEVAPELE